MRAFRQIHGLVIPIDRAHIDTDAIIPKQYLKSIKRSGFGPNLFDDWRYLDPGEPYIDHGKRRLNPEFVLNQERYRQAEILLTRENFGCGSSREHAVWALVDYGIRVVIAPSFADIFLGNTVNNGLLAIALDNEIITRLFMAVNAQPGYKLLVDLAAATITTPQREVIPFTIEPHRRQRLLHGLDDIDLTLAHAEDISQYELRRQKEAPWLF
jgi:3-isopropylmalate/(R)-2-methylmalate dehydratase small subunit